MLHQSPALLGHPSLENSRQRGQLPAAWPSVVVVCMNYGAHLVANDIHKRGAPNVFGIPIDLCSPDNASFATKLSCSLLALVGEGQLTPQMIAQKLEEYMTMDEGLNSFGSDTKRYCDDDFVEEDISQCSEHCPWPIESYPCLDHLPKQLADLHLQLRAGDLKILPPVQQDCKKQKQLGLVSSSETDCARAVAPTAGDQLMS